MWKCSSTLMICCMTIMGGHQAAYADSLIDASGYRALTSDRRAYRVGEPLIILVVESTTAESSAGTGARSDVVLAGSAYYGSGDASVGLGMNGRDEASGQTSRKGRAFTQLSARIVEILPGNLFRISGEQNLIVNGENQKVVLSGIVRSDDIGEDNTMPSNRIADAKIEITGDGVIDDANKQSIIYRVLKWLRVL